MSMIRVASYNIQKAIGLDARRDPHRILDVIAEVDPDILALQEVDRRFGARHTTIPVCELAKRTDLKVVAVPADHMGLGWHGNVILIRKSAQCLSQHCLDLPSLEPRGALITRVQVKTAVLRIVSVHLSLIGRIREKQVVHIVNRLKSESDNMPTVIMGDLNEWYSSSRSMQRLHPRYSAAPTGPSFPSPVPIAALDKIFVSPEL